MVDSDPASSGVKRGGSDGDRLRRELVAEYAPEIARCAAEASGKNEDWVLLVIAANDSVGRMLVDHYGLARNSPMPQDFYLLPKPYEEAASWFAGEPAQKTFRASLPPEVTASGLLVHLVVIAFEGVSLLEVPL